MLAQLKVTPDGSVSPIMKVKLSMAAEGGKYFVVRKKKEKNI